MAVFYDFNDALMGLAHADGTKKKVARYQIRQGLCSHFLAQGPIGDGLLNVLFGAFKIV